MITTPAPTVQSLPLRVLHLDPWNPRLPQELQGKREEDLPWHIAHAFNAIDVARSIARHGYFPSEPLIAIPRGRASFLVVEGNRRLVALRLLADPKQAAKGGNAAEWRSLAATAALPDRLPVVVAKDRDAVAPIIGYRHISGVRPWEPYPKARFVAGFIDYGASFAEAAQIVGQSVSAVATQYRNFTIIEQTRSEFGVDVSKAIRQFGVFTYAMSSLNLRAHIGARRPSQTRPHERPLTRDAGDAVRELFSWLFGDDEHPPVMSDSREITRLSKVLGSESALAVLRTTRSLDRAYGVVDSSTAKVRFRLTTVYTHLQSLQEELAESAIEPTAQLLIRDCARLLSTLKRAHSVSRGP